MSVTTQCLPLLLLECGEEVYKFFLKQQLVAVFPHRQREEYRAGMQVAGKGLSQMAVSHQL